MTWNERSTGLMYPWWRTSTVDDSDVDGVYQAIGAGILSKAYINWINLGTNDLVPNVDPTFDNEDGWQFSGAEFLDSSIVGTGSQSFLVRLSDQPTADKNTLIGYNSGSKLHYLAISKIDATTINVTFGYNITSSTPGNITVANADNLVVGMARNRLFVDGAFQVTAGTLATWTSGVWDVAENVISGRFIGNVQAVVIYNRLLTDVEMATITANMQSLNAVSHPTGGLSVNYIVQNPRTKHLSSFSHELLIATDGGIYRTFNGGRSWGQLELPDPSNAEFGDVPAATVDELTFHWVAYDPLTLGILYALGYKASVNRVWIYRSVDGLTWSSRGVIAS